MLDKIKEVKEARNALHCLNLEAPGAVVDNVIMKVEAAFRAIQAQQGDPADEAIETVHPKQHWSGYLPD